MLLPLLRPIISILGALLAIAFFTLIERKFIGLIHYRKGPNKVLIIGLSQPIADAIKLLRKERTKFFSSKLLIIVLGPTISLLIIILCWVWFNFSFIIIRSNIKTIVFFSIIRLRCYGLILIRWGSNSKYAILGGLRGVSQIISYEVCLFLFVLIVAFFRISIKYYSIEIIQQGLWNITTILPVFIIWLTLCMAESNRTPFDIAEGEREIVSGFNIEYGGGLFALIFIREYGIIIFLRFITSLFFLGRRRIIKIFTICFIFIWTRRSFPRVRYDQLIIFSWKIALPLSLILISFTLVC